MRLAGSTQALVTAPIERFAYDRQAQAAGIVHFGIGAFHRAHQAWYTDRAMDAGDRDWAIVGVSLQSAAVAAQLNPQDGLYTATERSAGREKTRLIGSIRRVLVAREELAAVVAAVADPATRIVSFTITEKGYCQTPDGTLDRTLAHSGSIYGLVAAGLHRRRDLGLPGITFIPCDNIADNGRVLSRLMSQHLENDPALRDWFAGECACVGTMVDRIVPATTAQDRQNLAASIGIEDEAAVMTEPFSQWVIEDQFVGPRPGWERVGAELVSNVAPYEAAKLRLLNGAHSALAYLGLGRGHTFVHQAIADHPLRGLVEQLMRSEALPTLTPAAGQDLEAYVSSLLERFVNPALEHRLLQIAMDGSQKIPQRWLATLADAQDAGRTCPAILTALGAWLRHVRGDNVSKWGPVDDPLAAQLGELWKLTDETGVVRRLFSAGGLMADAWAPTPADEQYLLASIKTRELS